MIKIFKNCIKYHFRVVFGPFLQKIGPTKIFLENWALSGFNSHKSYTLRKSKITNQPFLLKTVIRQAEGRTDGRRDGLKELILQELCVSRGSKK